MQVVGYVRAIRKGLITFDKPKEEDGPYLLWGDDSGSTEKSNHLAYIPAPKPKVPGINVTKTLEFKIYPKAAFYFFL